MLLISIEGLDFDSHTRSRRHGIMSFKAGALEPPVFVGKSPSAFPLAFASMYTYRLAVNKGRAELPHLRP